MMLLLQFFVYTIINSTFFASDNTRKPKFYTIQDFLNAPNKELLQHKQQLDSLQKQGYLNITPSQSLLFYPDPILNRQKLESNLKSVTNRIKPSISPLERFKNFVMGYNDAHYIFTPDQADALNKAMAKEQEVYNKGGIVTYHSTQPSYYGLSYIRTKEHDFLLDILGTPVKPSKMLLIRDNYCRTNIKTEKEKRKEYLRRGVPANETDWTHSQNLLSCNVSLTGNSITKEGEGESSLYYWLKKVNVNPQFLELEVKNKAIIVNEDKLSESLMNALNELNTSVKTGVLLQISFKDKNIVDDVMYSAAPWGHKLTYLMSKENSLKNLDYVAKPTEIIDTMMQKPSSFKTPHYIDNVQMRIILTGDKLLNPTDPVIRKNIEFEAYADNQNALDKFQTQVDTIFARAKEEYISRYNKMLLPQKFWHNLKLNLFYKQTPYKEQKRIKKESEYWFIAQ